MIKAAIRQRGKLILGWSTNTSIITETLRKTAEAKAAELKAAGKLEPGYYDLEVRGSHKLLDSEILIA